MSHNKRTYLTIFIVIAAISFVAVGILKGWFRDGGKLSEEENLGLASVKKAEVTPAQMDAARENFRRLWHDHVALTRDVIVSEFNDSTDLDSKVKLLMANQEDIGDGVDRYYPGSGPVVTELLKEHISIAKDILDDLKLKRLTRVAGDINRWYDNADRFSMAMKKINPEWSLRDHMKTHLDITENEALAEFMGLDKVSKGIYDDKIVPQAQDIADHLADGIKKDNASSANMKQQA